MSLNIKTILLIIFSLIVIPSCAESNSVNKEVGEKYNYLKQILKENNIDGIAAAFFTKDEIIWKECLGKSTYNKPINDSTLFGICSISKNFTSLAVMFAVQDGLLDLDKPIINYLPNFTVNSCYEESPEDKISLRMMLSNTAGFTHEAPKGNNVDYSCKSKQEHWNSIRETWLKFPVDTGYSYSALGFDLAAEIIEKVSGQSFEAYVKEKIFMPLDMEYSTFSDSVFLSNNNRTEGVLNPFVKENHKKIPQIGAAGAYSNIDDMVKYVQFHLNFGNFDNKQLIEKKHLLEMYTINRNFYGLGTGIERPDNNEKLETFYLIHNGGGFGYASTMMWFPEYGLGCVILGNKTSNFYNAAINIITEYILKNEKILNSKNPNIGFTPVFKPWENSPQNLSFIYPNIVMNSKNLKGNSIVGKYEIILDMTEAKWLAKIAAFIGIKFVKIKVFQENDKLITTGYFGRYELTEYISGLYFTNDGEAFDIRNNIPTFKNIKLRKYSNK